MTAARKITPDEIPEPSLTRQDSIRWGDEFAAAYTQAKRHFEPGVVTYEAVAERVSRLVRTTQTTILRLGYLDHEPVRPSQRQVAYLALVAMGFDPSEFGLTVEDGAIRGLTDIEIRKMLDPGQLGAGLRDEFAGDEVARERADVDRAGFKDGKRVRKPI